MGCQSSGKSLANAVAECSVSEDDEFSKELVTKAGSSVTKRDEERGVATPFVGERDLLDTVLL